MKINDYIHFTCEAPEDQEAGTSCLSVWWWGKIGTHFGDCRDRVTAWLLFSPLSSCLKLTIQYLQTLDASEPCGEEAEFVVWVLSPQQLPVPGSQRLLFSLLSSPFCHYNGAIVRESGGLYILGSNYQTSWYGIVGFTPGQSQIYPENAYI